MSWGHDNVIFEIDGCTEDRLSSALSLAMDGKFAGYRIHDKLGFILYSYKTGRMIEFPVKISYQQAAKMVFDWLKTDAARKMIGNQMDHDGDNGEGWIAYTEAWGHADGDWNCVIVKPKWLCYGK